MLLVIISSPDERRFRVFLFSPGRKMRNNGSLPAKVDDRWAEGVQGGAYSRFEALDRSHQHQRRVVGGREVEGRLKEKEERRSKPRKRFFVEQLASGPLFICCGGG
jgi:hypothetical protein